MGLDIYFYKVKKARNANKSLTIEELNDLNNKRAKKRFQRFAERAISRLEHTDAEDYVRTYDEIFAKMPKYTPYEFHYEHMLPEAKPIEDVKKFFNKFGKYYHAQSDAYFRKVNFIYRYFSHQLEDECCIVRKNDLDDLLDRCDKVLENHHLAEELLPTQSGPFFGSTDYDNYYFDKVENAKKQFTQLLDGFDEKADAMYAVFSW